LLVGERGGVSLGWKSEDVHVFWMDHSVDEHCNIQATVRFAAGSVYFVRLGSGVAGRLGMSW
jgi:hypothetical protein